MAKNSANSAAPAATPASFEAALSELDALVARMENGQLPLEESISAYQRGSLLLKHCETLLSDAQQRIQILEGNELKDVDA